ncbi:MAG: phosphatase PAP2 family protein [Angustibacter sp.]
MNGAVIVAVGWLGAVAVVGVLLTANADRLVAPPRWRAASARARAATAGCVQQLGRGGTALIGAAAGVMITLVALWAGGKLAHALEDAVDWPVFRYFEARQLGGGWQHAWNLLTQMGNRPETQAITVVAAVGFAVVWRLRGRSWWAPLVTLPGAYLAEKFGGIILKKVVDRGHPPTTLGTWVSGGCARLLVAYGLVILLLLVWLQPSRRVRVGAWSFLAFLAAVEAYSRTYLLKHWVTDVVGGLLFGVLLLVVAGWAFRVLDGRADEVAAASDERVSPRPAARRAGSPVAR